MPGSGPRHVGFFVALDGPIYMHLVSEMSNTTAAYRVLQ